MANTISIFDIHIQGIGRLQFYTLFSFLVGVKEKDSVNQGGSFPLAES